MPPKKKDNLNRKTRLRKNILIEQRAAVEESIHALEFFEQRKAICTACGIQLTIIKWQPTGLTGEKRPSGGWETKKVWGGDENGIGGLLSEPPCRSGRR